MEADGRIGRIAFARRPNGGSKYNSRIGDCVARGKIKIVQPVGMEDQLAFHAVVAMVVLTEFGGVGRRDELCDQEHEGDRSRCHRRR